MALKRDAALPEERDAALDALYAFGPREEPPGRLDDALRAAARREVRSGPRPLRSRLRAWRLPVSIAAVLVLSASLVTLMKDERADRFYEGPAPESPRTGPLHTPPPAAAPPAGERAAPAEEARTRHDDRATPDRQYAAGSEPGGARRDDRARRAGSVIERAQPATASPAPPAAERQGRQAESDARHSVPLTDRAAPFAADPPARPAAPGEGLAKRTEPALGPGSRPGQPAGTSAQDVHPAPGAAADRGREHREIRAAPAPRAEAGAAASASRPPVWAGFERQAPEKWVERIEELRREGREADAREMQEEFRKRFPDYAR